MVVNDEISEAECESRIKKIKDIYNTTHVYNAGDFVKDTTGAGDTFNGNLAYCLTHNYELKDAIVRSQHASSMKVQVPTAQAGMPYEEELDKYVSEIEDQ